MLPPPSPVTRVPGSKGLDGAEGLAALSKHSCQVRVGGPHEPASLRTLRFTGNSRSSWALGSPGLGSDSTGGRASALGMPSNFTCHHNHRNKPRWPQRGPWAGSWFPGCFLAL